MKNVTMTIDGFVYDLYCDTDMDGTCLLISKDNVELGWLSVFWEDNFYSECSVNLLEFEMPDALFSNELWESEFPKIKMLLQEFANVNSPKYTVRILEE